MSEPPFTQPFPQPSSSGHDETPSPVFTLPAGYQRPSEGWLCRPAWIDGGVNPPRFYASEQMMDEELRLAGISPKSRKERLAPTVASSSPTYSSPLSAMNFNSVTSTIAAPLDLVGSHYRPEDSSHLVTVAFQFPKLPTTSVRGKPGAPKKSKVIKMDKIDLGSISRVDFVSKCLQIHKQGDKFAPGIHSGPNFKIWWNGASGGKGGAPTIQNDHQFAIALDALRKKDRAKTQVCVEFDIENMEGFRIKDVAVWEGRTGAVDNAEEELAYGTRVPTVESFSDVAQIHGGIIMELKKRWPCQSHLGEHGESGHCFVAASGEHIRLNPLRLKAWAAAIASQDATKHEPPNIAAFDGSLSRSKVVVGPKPRGRAGPNGLQNRDDSSPIDCNTMAMLVNSFLPLVGTLSRKRRASSSEPPSTPKRPKAPNPPSPVSSLPEQGSELQACLAEFKTSSGYDLTPSESILRAEDYTPDVIPLVADDDLQRITSASHGVILKLKVFCKDWQAHYDKKVRVKKSSVVSFS